MFGRVVVTFCGCDIFLPPVLAASWEECDTHSLTVLMLSQELTTHKLSKTPAFGDLNHGLGYRDHRLGELRSNLKFLFDDGPAGSNRLP
jgi:hypothetical protein